MGIAQPNCLITPKGDHFKLPEESGNCNKALLVIIIFLLDNPSPTKRRSP